ncbi:hypothetical protein Emtol_0209 (plasmid) [Emticicia oligotrophica DSM 17448]|uniref:Uncharacterized protein n=1 Tax=Emticicia oligotrophica (strain DSM 17448 / CIP 109782 / MTCC 6937 / GPTSA100-15) TaxID=929562 RepID=A0ABM5N7K9_EMTOG|nr:hypothetical protein [Emticicia oligotrophica]AFK05481.1 hypothetical protein Emtol_0209 [Emticicia oligotrophica DSM 17448]
MSNQKIQISIKPDENGFIGRECLVCKRYFKLKQGTGLPTNHCHCPYCDYEGDQDTFWTSDQIEYAKSIATKIAYEQFIEPAFEKLKKSFEQLEESTKNSFIKIEVKTSRDKPFFPIKYYSESELETNIICDSCKLEFAIYGVFSRCPDCEHLNAFSIFKKSIEVCNKQFQLFSVYKNDDEITTTNLKFILGNAISSFDALGKELRKKIKEKFPEKPRNLFQNIDELEKVMLNSFSVDLRNEISDFAFLKQMFQVRHIFEHNMGVIDSDFVKKVPSYENLLNRKYKLTIIEVERFLLIINELGDLIESQIKKIYT